jgi:hypothetical protein
MNADDPEQLTFVEGGAEFLDRIEPLWKQQTVLHAKKSRHFAEHFTTANFSDRKESVRAKGANRDLVGHFGNGRAGRNCWLYGLLSL